MSPWKPIYTLQMIDDEVWLARGDSFEGPRPPNSGDFDRWDWWCEAVPPPLPPSNAKVCTNCDEPCPPGCGGVNRDDGEACALNAYQS